MVLDRDGLSLWHTHIFASLSHIIICNRLWWSKLICKNCRCWLSWFRRSHVFSGGHHLFLNLHFSLSSSSIGTQGYNSTGCSHDNFQIDCWWFYSQQQVEILNTLMDTGTIWVKLKSPIDKSGQVTLVVLWNSISWEIILLFFVSPLSGLLILELLLTETCSGNDLCLQRNVSNSFWKFVTSRPFRISGQLSIQCILLDTGLIQWPF